MSDCVCPQCMLKEYCMAHRSSPVQQDDLATVMCLQEPPAPAPGVEQEEEGPMYFQDPRTLLQIYAQLEEQNLFLIQNAQESEEALEELRAKFRCVPTASVCYFSVKTPAVYIWLSGHAQSMSTAVCAADAARGQWSSWCSGDRGP